MYTALQRQAAVTAYLESKQLLLFAFALQCRHGICLLCVVFISEYL